MVPCRLTSARSRCAYATLAVAALASAAAYADKPQLLVQFEVNVPAFQTNLPERDIAQQRVREAVSQEFARQFVFATWSTETPERPQAQLGRLVLRLEQDLQTSPNPRVYVTWFGVAGAAEGVKPKDLGMERIEIYSPGNPNWDTNNRRDFETRVLGKTIAKVNNDEFYKTFFKKFLARLPIAATVEPQAAERVIEVPVPWNEVLLSSDSKLVVRFNRLIDQVNQEGSLTLSHLETRTASGESIAAGFPARLRGAITEAEFDGRPVILDQNWNDGVPEMLNGATAHCYISDYRPRDELAPDSDDLLGI